MPHGCPLGAHSECATDGTGAARPASAPPPTDGPPAHCCGQSNVAPGLAQSPWSATSADGVPIHRLGLLGLSLVYGGAGHPSAEGPPTGGIATTRGSNWVTSWRLALVRMAAKGIPRASVITWCLLPGLRRCVGLGPVSPLTNRSDGPAIHHPSAEGGQINLVSCPQFGQQKRMKPLPNLPSAEGPITETAPAGHARAALHLVG